MKDGGLHDNNLFPHDGEGKIKNCTGPGCDCDERNYGYRGSRPRKRSKCKGTTIAIVIAVIFGLFINELIGTAILIGVVVYEIYH
jgi:hypothetical protein